MKHEKALEFMCNCAIAAIGSDVEENNNSNLSFGFFATPSSCEEIKSYLSYICSTYKNIVQDGCAKDKGYLIKVDRICDCHPVFIYVTLYLMLIADANIYVLYDGSYYDYDPQSMLINRFLDEFIKNYQKAEKIIVSEAMTYKEDMTIEWFFKSHTDVKDVVYFGDFINYHPNEYVLKKLGVKAHFPAAHYVIMNYSSENIPARDKLVLNSFGEKCWHCKIDYAAYVSDDNKHSPCYGFDIDVLYTDLAYYNTLKKYKGSIDKIVTVIFSDKSKSELNYPEEFYDLFEVYFSKKYNDNIINYDFTQLFC